MKKILATVAALLISAATYGQGQLAFDNIVGGAKIGLQGSAEGPGSAGGFADVVVTPVAGGASIVLAPPTPFFDFDGFRDTFTTATYTVTGVPIGAQVNYVVRAWIGGSTFEAASATGQIAGAAPYTLGGGPNPPENLPFGAFSVVPEPSTLALGVIGAAALFLRRRK